MLEIRNQFRIATDGDCLVVYDVPIGKKRYDIRVWRENDSGFIPIDPENDVFAASTIASVQEEVAKIYAQMDEEDRSCIKIHVEKNGEAYTCSQEDTRDVGSLSPIDANERAYASARKVHNLFFNTIGTAVPLKDGALQNLILKPEPISKVEIVVPPRPQDFVVGEEDEAEVDKGVSSSAKEAKVETVETKKKEETVDPKTLPKTEQNDYLDLDLNKITSSHFPGLTYLGLQAYAKDKDKKDAQYAGAYNAFVKLLKDPNSKGEDEKQMYEWLSQLYIHSYNAHKSDKSLDPVPDDQTRGDAAAYVVGYIIVDKTSYEKLVESLKSLEMAI